MAKYELRLSSRYVKDLKRARKRGLDESKLNAVLEMLANGEKLPYKYRNHKLTGNYEGSWECHIEPDWLLIYRIKEELQIISLQRTGSHSDLLSEPEPVYGRPDGTLS